MFREEWVVQITHKLNLHSQADADPILRHEHSQADADPILRVARPLLSAKPEAYIPQVLCLGPYHHGMLEKDIDSSCGGGTISTEEAYKVKFAVRLSQELRNSGKNFSSILEIMKKELHKIGRFYHWPISSNIEGEYSKRFALMMAVDSSFLIYFFISLFYNSDTDMFNVYRSIKHDVLKLENQIPLFVLSEVFEELKDPIKDVDFNALLKTAIVTLSPFRYYTSDYEVAMGRHLLDCMHGFVSEFLEIQGCEENPQIGADNKRTLRQKLKDAFLVICVNTVPCLEKFERPFLNGSGASKLFEAGIKFKSFSNFHYGIRLDKYSATLYLPEITVSNMDTEVFLRNMLALEFNNATSNAMPVTCYVALMTILLQSPKDVRILIDQGIIYTGVCSMDDEEILNMWKGVSQPFFRGSLDLISKTLSRELEAVLDEKRTKTKIERAIGGLVDFLLSLKFLGSFAAFLALVLTGIQTYYAVFVSG